MAVLTTKQKQYLKGLAHPLAPVVRIGKGGLSDAVLAETRNALASHELIKVRIDVDDGATRREIATRLAVAADAHLAGTVGKIAILYREREEEPEITFPG